MQERLAIRRCFSGARRHCWCGDGGNDWYGPFAWVLSASGFAVRPQHAFRAASRRTDDRGGDRAIWERTLAASIAVLHRRVDARELCAAQREMLVRLVENAGAVDGVATPEPTVDGVPFLTGIEPWAAIRRELGLSFYKRQV